MNRYLKICLMIIMLSTLSLHAIKSVTHKSVPQEVAAITLYNDSSKTQTKRSGCCNKPLVCYTCVPGVRSCISQAIRAKYCPI